MVGDAEAGSHVPSRTVCAGERGTCVEDQKGTKGPLVSIDVNVIETQLQPGRLPVFSIPLTVLLTQLWKSEIPETTRLLPHPGPSIANLCYHQLLPSRAAPCLICCFPQSCQIHSILSDHTPPPESKPLLFLTWMPAAFSRIPHSARVHCGTPPVCPSHSSQTDISKRQI